jgi:hypothetical protein
LPQRQHTELPSIIRLLLCTASCRCQGWLRL